MYYEDPSGHVPQCVKEAATEYIEKGMSPEDAYCKAYAEHAERKLMQGSELSPQERYKLEQKKKRLDEKLPKSPEADNKKFYDEQYKRRLKQTPKEGERGHWLGDRGESMYIPSNPKIKKILEKYGLKGIKYKNGVPDFSDVAWKTVQVQGMAGGKKKERPRNINFPLAFNELSNQMGISSTKLKKWATQKRLTWHECNDMKTMQLIPTDINDYFGHMGGVGEINLYFDFLEGLF